jgi:hypothetical protein
VRTNGATPYEELGELKLATGISILVMCSNIKVENLHLQGTGQHGMRGNRKDIENVEIVNNIVEDIGGIFNSGKERYGNGIDFFQIDVKNVKIHKNIVRNTYDVAFTIQGVQGSGTNISLTKNIFCLNSQDSEIWQNSHATGIYNYNFEDNISFLVGRGWGNLARPDKYCTCHILFWGYGFDNVEEKTKIYFNHNYIYNPKRIYFIAEYLDTHILFQKDECIRSDFNHYYLNNDSFIYWDRYNFSRKDNFIEDFNKDKNSEFILLDKEDPILVDKITNSLDYNELRKIFVNDEKGKNHSNAILISIIVIVIIALLLIGGFFIFRYFKTKKDDFSLGKLMNLL